MDKPTFIQAINALGTAKSVRGKTYENVRVQNGKVWLVRGSSGKTLSIYLDELYSLYRNEPNPNPKVARNYITGYGYSPAIAILNALKALGGAAPKTTILKPHPPPSRQPTGVRAESDEARFFNALAKVLGNKYVKSKNLGKPVSGQDVFLRPNYRTYQFDEKIEKAYGQILLVLMSSGEFSSKSLAHYIDGLVVNHPKLGSRIVEFDEEQHFTPARRDALQVLGKHVSLPYIAPFLKICNNLDYLQNEVLKKHRVRSKLAKPPASFKDFVKWLENSGASESGYIKSKTGFEYLGGRMAQRAYYDCLRDTAHLSPKNKGLELPLRFPKRYFEVAVGGVFSQISSGDLKELMVTYLSDVYRIKI